MLSLTNRRYQYSLGMLLVVSTIVALFVGLLLPSLFKDVPIDENQHVAAIRRHANLDYHQRSFLAEVYKTRRAKLRDCLPLTFVRKRTGKLVCVCHVSLELHEEYVRSDGRVGHLFVQEHGSTCVIAIADSEYRPIASHVLFLSPASNISAQLNTKEEPLELLLRETTQGYQATFSEIVSTYRVHASSIVLVSKVEEETKSRGLDEDLIEALKRLVDDT